MSSFKATRKARFWIVEIQIGELVVSASGDSISEASQKADPEFFRILSK